MRKPRPVTDPTPIWRDTIRRWPPERREADWEERAAIKEYDGKMSREQAEGEAWDEMAGKK